jgi:4,5-dihydroxyphthalate decarboxylase
MMGEDFWPYGIEPNRKVIEALCQYTFEQGLVPVRVEVEDLFADSVVALAGERL